MRSFVVFLLLIGCVFFVIPPVSAQLSGPDLIVDGSMVLEGYTLFRTETGSNPYDIEAELNTSYSITANIESLSEDILEIEFESTYSVESAYQKRYGTTYYPDSYAIWYFDETLTYIGSDDLSFTLTYQVNKHTGNVTLAHIPQGASVFSVVALYDDPEVFESHGSFPGSFAKVDGSIGLLRVNASDWKIGDSVVEGSFTVSGEGNHLGYDAWIIENVENIEGFSSSSWISYYEKTTGLFMRAEIHFEEVNVATYIMSERVISLGDIIDDGLPTVAAPDGQEVDSDDDIILTFTGEDLHFSHYNLYMNGTLNFTGTNEESQWIFTITPNEGNTTWTFEIVDSLGHSNNASTWVHYEPPPVGLDPAMGLVLGGGAIGVIGGVLVIYYLMRRRTGTGKFEFGY